MLYIFDKDGTLVGGPVSRPANTPAEQVLLPNVADKIAALRADGHTIAIASNQGGVAWGFITIEQADELLKDCAEKIGGAEYRFCPHDERKGQACECRKPKPGMLLDLMHATGYSPADTIFIGDQQSDQQAADNAGCDFQDAESFFKIFPPMRRMITAHKGGRVERFEARLTPAENKAILAKVRESGLSKADWLVKISGVE